MVDTKSYQNSFLDPDSGSHVWFSRRCQIVAGGKNPKELRKEVQKSACPSIFLHFLNVSSFYGVVKLLSKNGKLNAHI